jgi:hypothetical protein
MKDLDNMNLHNLPDHPHWSEGIEWRDGRWDSMSSAPTAGYPVLHVRGRDEHGAVIEDMHYAYGDGDGLMPAFRGWFKPDVGGRGYVEVRPVEWQPLHAKPQAAPEASGMGV